MRERTLQFGRTANLVGVLTEPDEARRRKLPGILLLNAGILHRVGPSRMNVRIARSLASRGFPCLRFDFSGIGDSLPRPDRLPFEESSVEEIRAAMDHLQETQGVDGFVLLGLCSGADAAFQGAAADERVVGIVPIDGHAYRTWRFYLHQYLPRLVRAESWKNLLAGRTYVGPWIRRVLGRESADGAGSDGRPDAELRIFQRPLPPREAAEERMRTLVRRGVRMLHVFSGGMAENYNYESQFRDMYRGVEFRGLARVAYFEDADHTFTDLRRLDRLVRTITEWAVAGWAVPAPSAAASPEERAA